MRLLRYSHDNRIAYGVFREGSVIPVADVFSAEVIESGSPVSIEEVRLLAPVVPTKIVAVGLNYSDHAEELGMEIPDEPLLFLKPPSAVTGPGGSVVYPGKSHRVDHEAELAVVIGVRAHAVTEEEALSRVLGYTCALDMTARDLQMIDGQWTRAKSFDTFCPLGPWVETEVQPGDLEIESRLNGEVRQSSRTCRMIFQVPQLISFISEVMTLEPGDVILTGTPPGVGETRPGDHLQVTIEGIGELECSVVTEGER